MTNTIQVCSDFHWARVLVIDTRPDKIGASATSSGDTGYANLHKSINLLILGNKNDYTIDLIAGGWQGVEAYFEDNILCGIVLLVQILHPTPYTLHPTLHPTSYTLHPTPYTLHPTPYTLHPTPYILHPALYTLHPTPYTLHPTPYTLHSNA